MTDEGDPDIAASPPGSRPGSSFASDVLKLAGGTAFAQALAILALPLITRLTAPEAFGLAARFTTIPIIRAVPACVSASSLISCCSGRMLRPQPPRG